MKDLKHLIYFENLLEDANNELVRQAQENGSIVLGYTCYHIPEVLLNVDNCISVRLRAPKTGSLDISTYYMSNYTCDYARALVERAIEGGYQFLDAMIGVDACSAMNRSMEHFEVLKVNSKEKFFVTHTDMPLKVTDYYIDSYTTQMREHVLNRLTETFGVDTSDEALRKAVAEQNEVCKIISEIAEMRKLDNPIITGYEFHILNLVSYTCPKALILPYLRETLAELKKRKPDAKSPYRARVAIVGSEIDDPSLTKLIEGCGAFHSGHGMLRLSPGGPEAAVQTMLLCHSLGLAASMSLADGVPVVDMSPASDTPAGLLSSGLVPEHAVKQAAWSQASRVRILTPSSCAESYDVITESGGIDLNGVC